jgi:two-component system, LytTR family, sensor kinase
MQLERYSKREPIIFLWFMLPYTVIINLILCGTNSVSSFKNFSYSFGTSLLYFIIIYAVFGGVATLVKKRFPHDGDLFRRIAVMLPVFYVMNILSVQGLYLLYEKLEWSGLNVKRNMEWWVTGFGCLASTILTFINEAAANWEKWKASVTETTRMQTAYNKNRLLSLQHQINPHFLFNCFNTLSSLINEDEDAAETFLNEMTKVYRYLLKGDEEQLVNFERELKFIESYLYLGITRFGNALNVNIEISDEAKQKKIAPLSLQIIIENIIYSNAFSKAKPLFIHIYTTNNNKVVIENSIQQKKAISIINYEDTLSSLITKYSMHSAEPVTIEQTETQRRITIPLLENLEVTA